METLPNTNFLSQKNVQVAIGALVGLGGGLIAGYFIGRRATLKEAEEKIEQAELASVQDELERIRAKRREREAKEAQEQIEHPSTVVIEQLPKEDSEPAIVTSKVFAQSTETWDYDKEIAKRDGSAPYVLHLDEFKTNELDFKQYTWTYYDGDGVMANEQDVPVYNWAQKVGELRFGHGSGDQNIFYVRNMKDREEYEILFDRGVHAIESGRVDAEDYYAGQKGEIQHSKVQKFRRE